MMDVLKQWGVYAVIERAREVWICIGKARRDREGQWFIDLDALPTNGRLVIRPMNPRDLEGHRRQSVIVDALMAYRESREKDAPSKDRDADVQTATDLIGELS